MASRIRHHAMNKKQRTLFACPRTPPQQEQEEKEKQTASISSQTNPQQRPYRVLSLGILSRECWAFTGVYRMVLEHGFQLYPVYSIDKPDHSSRGQNEAVYPRSKVYQEPCLGAFESAYGVYSKHNTAPRKAPQKALRLGRKGQEEPRNR